MLRKIFAFVLIIGLAQSRRSHHEQRRRSQQGCEGTVLQLSCEDGLVISPVRANYGRFSRSVCNAESNPDWSTRCIQPTSLRVVSGLCAGMTSCSVDVTSNVFGDPCPGTYKYLEVHYMCVKKEEEGGRELPHRRDSLPPWLMKMSATTSRTPRTTEAVTTSPLPLITEVDIETFYPEEDMDTESMEYEDVLIPMDIVENVEEAKNEVYINLPYRKPDWDSVESFEVDLENTEAGHTGSEKTLLIATLVSLSACSTVLILSAILYTRYRRTRSKTTKLSLPTTINSSEYHQQPLGNTQQATASSQAYTEYYESSDASTASTSTVSSLYTTLPNGQQAIVIPITAAASQQLFAAHSNATTSPSFGGHQPRVISYPVGNNNLNVFSLTLPSHGVEGMPTVYTGGLDNIYTDIDYKDGGRY